MPDDFLRTYIQYACYVFLITLWSNSIFIRVSQKNMRIYMLCEAGIMLFGLTVRFLQDTFWCGNIPLVRASGLWLAATITPMLLLGLYASFGIGEINQYHMEKELPSAKIRIHDDFGGLLVMTGNRIANGKAGEDDAELFRAWEDVIADMENASRREITISASPENELLKIAEMIECHIDIIGDKPKERKRHHNLFH